MHNGPHWKEAHSCFSSSSPLFFTFLVLPSACPLFHCLFTTSHLLRCHGESHHLHWPPCQCPPLQALLHCHPRGLLTQGWWSLLTPRERLLLGWCESPLLCCISHFVPDQWRQPQPELRAPSLNPPCSLLLLPIGSHCFLARKALPLKLCSNITTSVKSPFVLPHLSPPVRPRGSYLRPAQPCHSVIASPQGTVTPGGQGPQFTLLLTDSK